MAQKLGVSSGCQWRDQCGRILSLKGEVGVRHSVAALVPYKQLTLLLQRWARDNTAVTALTKMTMFSGQNMVDYCIMALFFIAAVLLRDNFLRFFRIFLVSEALLGYRVVAKPNNCPMSLCPLHPQKLLYLPLPETALSHTGCMSHQSCCLIKNITSNMHCM